VIGIHKKISEGAPRSQKSKRSHYGRYRFLGLGVAFLVILVNPFVNYYLHQNFLQGWYQSLGIGSLWFVSPLEGLESLLVSKTTYLPSIVGMIIPILIALFLGRVFCSWLCPVTFILEIFDRLRKAFTGKKYIANALLVAKRVLWFTLITELVLSMVLGAPIFVFLSPPGLVGREIMMLVFFKTFAFEGGILILILFLELLTRRFFCRSFCPLGGLLAFIGRSRSLHVKTLSENCTDCGLCIRVCPMGLNPQIGEGQSAYCWNCGECLDSCHFDALHFAWKDK
jgi:ferredoxin-type protein NapH